MTQEHSSETSSGFPIYNDNSKVFTLRPRRGSQFDRVLMDLDFGHTESSVWVSRACDGIELGC